MPTTQARATTAPIAFLLIDSQSGLSAPNYWGTRLSTPHYQSNICQLLAAFRALAAASPQLASVIHVHHASRSLASPLHPSKPGFAAYEWCVPEGAETVLVKSESSGFVGTSLEKVIRDRRVRRLYIGGLVTDGCVGSTTRMAKDLHVVDAGPRVERGHGGASTVGEPDGGERREWDGGGEEGVIVVIADGTAAYGKGGFDAETVQKVHLESLREEFATIRSTAEVLEELERIKKEEAL